MRQGKALRGFLAIIVVLFAFAFVCEAQARGKAHPDRVIVVLKGKAQAGAVLKRHGITARHVYGHALRGFSGTFPPGLRRKLAADPDVAFIEQDIVAHAVQTLPAGVDRIDADLNVVANIDGVDERVDVDIAIIDTGIDLDHPDLNVVFDKSFVRRAKSGKDDNGHGTHVAGTAAALDNGIGVVGVAPGARLWALKVLDRNGSGWFADIIAAIDFVTANADQIQVVNMSLGGVGRLDSLRTAIQKSVAEGVVYVVAAGNESRDVYGPDGELDTSDDSIPAAYSEVATVSAMGDTDGAAGGSGPPTSYGTGDDTFASFTNFSSSVVAGNPVTSPGAAIDVAAPGVDILSTYTRYGGYAIGSGTSMASPHVAGAVALYIAGNGGATDAAGVYTIRQAIINAAEAQSDWGPIDTNDPDTNFEGLVNVAGGEVNQPPAVSITSPTNGAQFDSGATIYFAGTASDTEDGNLTASLAWTSSIDGPIGTGTGGSFSTALSDGTHTIRASVTDSGGKTGSDSITITVGTPPEPTTVSVDSIDYGTQGGRDGNKHLNITVALVDDLDQPVSGASVSIDVSIDEEPYSSDIGTTGEDGTVTFGLKNAPSGTYTTDVTNVTADGLTWEPGTPDNSFTK